LVNGESVQIGYTSEEQAAEDLPIGSDARDAYDQRQRNRQTWADYEAKKEANKAHDDALYERQRERQRQQEQERQQKEETGAASAVALLPGNGPDKVYTDAAAGPDGPVNDGLNDGVGGGSSQMEKEIEVYVAIHEIVFDAVAPYLVSGAEVLAGGVGVASGTALILATIEVPAVAPVTVPTAGVCFVGGLYAGGCGVQQLTSQLNSDFGLSIPTPNDLIGIPIFVNH